jgi:hypothetical protein
MQAEAPLLSSEQFQGDAESSLRAKRSNPGRLALIPGLRRRAFALLAMAAAHAAQFFICKIHVFVCKSLAHNLRSWAPLIIKGASQVHSMEA